MGALLLFLSLTARSEAVEVHHHSKWLVADGTISRMLVADPERWIRDRESFIRKAGGGRLPVIYKLDEDFVTAARTRRSVAVVDDCGDALCGVATDELRDEWELADLRALFAPRDAPPLDREAIAAAKGGRWEGEDVRAIAADIAKAGITIDPTDRLAYVPVAAAKPGQPERSSYVGPPLRRPIHGATMSVVNRPEHHLIADGSRLELQRLRELGFDTIALVPYAGQRGFAASDIQRFDRFPGGETDLSMKLAAARAHRLGMRVLLKPHVWPGRGGDPTQIEPADWKAWFASYERYLVHEALLARAIDADWLCIGTELSRTESRPEWRRLITVVRTLYHGRITYAANFDAFERTPFWADLDAVGVDAYFPLSTNPRASDDELRAGAAKVVQRLDAVAARTGRNVLLTELGYPSTAAPWIEPWVEKRGAAPAPNDQARAFDAMLSAVARSRRIGGFVVWKYESDPDLVDPSGYLPKAKPAEQIIRKYLR